MFAGGSLSEFGSAAAADAMSPIRARGGLSSRFKAVDGGTRIADLSETGGYRLLFPAIGQRHVEAVQINTGGGVVGGDRITFRTHVEAGADVVHSTQAAERIYRSSGGTSVIDVALHVDPDARLDWLPQPTILFSGSRLQRRFDVTLAASARFLMTETVVFGREAHGETLGQGTFSDSFRIRRDGRLIFADTIRLDGDLGEMLARPAIAPDSRAAALVVYVAPDAADRLEAAREALADAQTDCGLSTWNGMLSARFLARRPEDLLSDLARLLRHLAGRPLPRVWAT